MKVRISWLITIFRERNARRKRTRNRFAVVVVVPLLLPGDFDRESCNVILVLSLFLHSPGRPINGNDVSILLRRIRSPIATLGMLARSSATATIVDGDHERPGSVVDIVAKGVPFRILRRCLTAMVHVQYENSARNRRRSCA